MGNSSEGRSEGGADGGPAQESAERAADEAVASDRLLPGEDPSSRDPDDATHWIAVYSELLTFKQRILEEGTEEAAAMSVPAKRELESTDLVVLWAKAARLERRIGFWRHRLGKAGER